jgi:hypothetical protein
VGRVVARFELPAQARRRRSEDLTPAASTTYERSAMLAHIRPSTYFILYTLYFTLTCKKWSENWGSIPPPHLSYSYRTTARPTSVVRELKPYALRLYITGTSKIPILVATTLYTTNPAMSASPPMRASGEILSRVWRIRANLRISSGVSWAILPPQVSTADTRRMLSTLRGDTRCGRANIIPNARPHAMPGGIQSTMQ